jgi:hypothetical protein
MTPVFQGSHSAQTYEQNAHIIGGAGMRRGQSYDLMTVGKFGDNDATEGNWCVGGGLYIDLKQRCHRCYISTLL